MGETAMRLRKVTSRRVRGEKRCMKGLSHETRSLANLGATRRPALPPRSQAGLGPRAASYNRGLGALTGGVESAGCGRFEARAVPRARPPRRGRHGRGLPRPRPAAGPRGRDQGAPAERMADERRRALRAGGPGRLRPQPSQHRHHPRDRVRGRHSTSSSWSTCRARAWTAHPPAGDAARRGAADRDPDRGRARPGPRARASSTGT